MLLIESCLKADFRHFWCSKVRKLQVVYVLYSGFVSSRQTFVFHTPSFKNESEMNKVRVLYKVGMDCIVDIKMKIKRTKLEFP